MPPRPRTAIRLAAGLAAAAAAVCPALALADPLEITTTVMAEHRRAEPDGTTRIVLEKAARTAPGDRVVVVMRCRNTGRQPLADVALVDPLPRSLAYVGPYAGAPEPEVAAGGGQHFGPLATLRVTDRAGSRPATRADVTAVRWRVPKPIAPGAEAQFAFDATVR